MSFAGKRKNSLKAGGSDLVEESEITVEDAGRMQRWRVKEKICDGKETGK